MESVTLLIAVLLTALVLAVSPLHGLILYIAALAWYPSYVTVEVGTVDFNVCRIVIMSLFLSLSVKGYWKKRFKLCALDKLVLAYWCCQLAAGVTTTPIGALIENRAGGFFDVVLPYFAVRLIVTTEAQYRTVLKGILIVAVPLALMGIYQSLSGNNPFGFLAQYHAWKTKEYVPGPMDARFGFFRAQLTFPQPIMFGLFFAILGPTCVGLVGAAKRHKTAYALGVMIMGLGGLASVSSGPVLSGILAFCFVMCYKYRRYWKTAVIVLIGMCLIVEVISNRHFYDVIDRFTFSSGTAWYRSKLMEVGLGGGMSGHWLTGYGFVDPGWSRHIDGRSHTDMVNHYLLVLCRYGLVGFIPFALMIRETVKGLVRSSRAACSESLRWLIWCLGASLFGLLFAFFSVSLFGQATTMFALFLGFCGAMNVIALSTPTGHMPYPADGMLRVSRHHSSESHVLKSV